LANENQSDRLRFPEYFLSDLIHKSVREEIPNSNKNPTIFKQALVLAVDPFGGKLSNPDGQGSLIQVIGGRTIEIKAVKGPKNPRNSIKARILTDGEDQFVGDEDLTVFYPMLPENFTPPIKPGEHALVLFLDENNDNGLWVNKYPGSDGVNFTVGEKNFQSSKDESLTNLFPSLKKDSSEEEDLGTDEAASESSISGNNLTELFK
jgi:hypothetical protein